MKKKHTRIWLVEFNHGAQRLRVVAATVSEAVNAAAARAHEIWEDEGNYGSKTDQGTATKVELLEEED